MLSRIQERDRALSESEGILRGTFDSTADGILVVDEKGKVINSNGRFVEMWGIPEDLIVAGDDNLLLEYVLNQLKDPDAFIARVDELYGKTEESLEEIELNNS